MENILHENGIGHLLDIFVENMVIFVCPVSACLSVCRSVCHVVIFVLPVLLGGHIGIGLSTNVYYTVYINMCIVFAKGDNPNLFISE